MEIFIGIVFAIIIIIVFLYLKSHENKKDENIDDKSNALVSDNESYFPTVQIIENDAIVPLEKNKISDSNIEHSIALLDNYIPNSIRASKNFKNAAELLNKERSFFSSAKKGTENMMKVKGSNEVYGAQMANGNIGKQTKFLKEDKLVQVAGKNSIINAGFNVASMVVGQHYMNEINNKLDIMKEDIKGISDLLDAEFQGSLKHIISKMQEIIENKIEILNNEYSRDKRYNEILDLERDCVKLLGQTNDMITKEITDENIDYKEYEKQTKKIHKWFSRQQILQLLLGKIGDLRYVLACGNETSKLSHTQYNNYLKNTNSVNDELENWHKLNNVKLGVDTKQYRRSGKLHTIRKNTIGKIKEDWAYHKLNNDVVTLIDSQTNIKKLSPFINEKRDNVIKIQRYKGKYYNLLNE